VSWSSEVPGKKMMVLGAIRGLKNDKSSLNFESCMSGGLILQWGINKNYNNQPFM
jgi:hypothetical protein